MLYTTLKIKETEYKLRLNAKNAVQLEKKLGRHPLSILMDMQESTLPKTEDVIFILHASLQAYQHEITEDKTYDLYDLFMEEHGIEDLVNLIVEIYQTAGFIPKNIPEVTEEKN